MLFTFRFFLVPIGNPDLHQTNFGSLQGCVKGYFVPSSGHQIFIKAGSPYFFSYYNSCMLLSLISAKHLLCSIW